MSDRDQEQMDALLRQTMARTPVPSLSSHFDRKLEKRLRTPARLSFRARLTLAVYALAALVLSVWLMRHESIEWSLVILAVLAPLVWAGRFLQKDWAP